MSEPMPPELEAELADVLELAAAVARLEARWTAMLGHPVTITVREP